MKDDVRRNDRPCGNPQGVVVISTGKPLSTGRIYKGIPDLALRELGRGCCV